MSDFSADQTNDLFTCIVASHDLEQLHRFIDAFPQANQNQVLDRMFRSNHDLLQKEHLALFLLQEESKKIKNRGRLLNSPFFFTLKEKISSHYNQEIAVVLEGMWSDLIKSAGPKGKKEEISIFLSSLEEMIDGCTPKSLHAWFPLFDQIVMDLGDRRSLLEATFEKVLPVWKKKTTLSPELFKEVVKANQKKQTKDEAEALVSRLLYSEKKWDQSRWSDPNFYTPEVKNHVLSFACANRSVISVIHELEKKFGHEFVQSFGLSPKMLAENLAYINYKISRWSIMECAKVNVLGWLSDDDRHVLAQLLQCNDALLNSTQSPILEKVRQDLIEQKYGHRPLGELDFKAFFKTSHQEQFVSFMEHMVFRCLVQSKNYSEEDFHFNHVRLKKWGSLVHPTTKNLIQMVYEQINHPYKKAMEYNPEEMPVIKNIRMLGGPQKPSSVSFNADQMIEIYQSHLDKMHLSKKLSKKLKTTPTVASRKM